MRIGIDARLWNQSGVGRYIRNLVDNLQDIDKINQYILFVRSEDKVRLKSQNFKIVIADIPWHGFDEQLKFPKILNKYNLDIVHFPYYSVPIFYNKPFVVTIHDLIPLHFQTGKASALFFPFYKIKFLGFKFVVSKAAKKAEKIIVPSNATKEDIEDRLNIAQSKIKIIYEGVDSKLVSKKQIDSFMIKNYFLYVGNAYPHKNLNVLINAFKNIDKKDLKLILIGTDDFFYKELKKTIKDKRVIFLSNLNDAQIADYYKNSICYITPSLMEGFGLTGLEAMGNKSLVLASDIKTHREIYGDCAIYFDPKNSNDLRNNMEKILISGVDLKNKINEGFKRSQEFSWKKTAQETLKIYESSISLR